MEHAHEKNFSTCFKESSLERGTIGAQLSRKYRKISATLGNHLEVKKKKTPYNFLNLYGCLAKVKSTMNYDIALCNNAKSMNNIVHRNSG